MMCSCADSFLSEEPVGEFLPGQVESEENIEGIVTGAYAVLDGYYASDAINSGCSNWQFGDVVSDDAYKGGGGTGDQNQIHLMEIFNANPTGIDFEARWAALYEGIKRCNQAIRLLNGSEVKNKEQRLAEMRFLRGHYYFNLKSFIIRFLGSMKRWWIQMNTIRNRISSFHPINCGRRF